MHCINNHQMTSELCIYQHINFISNQGVQHQYLSVYPHKMTKSPFIAYSLLSLRSGSSGSRPI